MAPEPIPTWYFVLVVVHYQGRFLLVQECQHEEQWYIPAGKVLPGESLIEAAEREALEEGGIPVIPEGIIRIEHTPRPTGTVRVRVIFIARPKENKPPKDYADEQSLGARWFSLEELENLPLRGKDVLEILRYAASGAKMYPLDVISVEGASFKFQKFRW